MYPVKDQNKNSAVELLNVSSYWQNPTPIEQKWRVRALRGATTVRENSREAIASAVSELMEAIEIHNRLDTEEIVSVTFSVTSDLNAIFPAAIARRRQGWEDVPLLDVQHMYVENSLQKCIRVLIHFNTPLPKARLRHVYLRDAAKLRPDLALNQPHVTVGNR